MNKIATACCYYGKLPNYFNIFLSTVERNSFMDFLFITDEETVKGYKVPENFKIIIIPFEKLRERIFSMFPFKASLDSPYKLCDYKFAYGDIFREEFTPYDFFGWNDIDVVLGDMKKFISDEVLKCDVIGALGHFTLMRNTEKFISLYKESDLSQNEAVSYKDVFRRKESCYFDELFGFNKMTYNLKHCALPDCVADIMPYKFDFYCFHREEEGCFILEYDDGKLYKLFKDKKEEIAYAHMQKRAFKVEEGIDNRFYVKPNAFSLTSEYEKGENIMNLLDSGYKKAERIHKKSVFKKKVKNRIKSFLNKK